MLIQACKLDHIDIIFYIMQNQRVCFKTISRYAARYNSTKILNWLIPYKIKDINYVLSTCCGHGNNEIISKLLNMTDNHEEALVNASLYDNFETVKLILDKKLVDVNYDEDCSLYNACVNENYKIIKLLLDNGANALLYKKCEFNEEINTFLKENE